MSPLLAGFSVLSLNQTFAWRGFAALIGCSDDQASGSRMTDLVEVGRFKTLADARQQVLVLAAVGIECHLMRADRDVGLYVASTDVKQAVQELACYERENLPSGQRPLPARPPRHAVDAALALRRVAVLLRRGAQARPVCRLGRGRRSAGGPDPRRGVVANVYRPEPPCRCSPFDEQSGLRCHLRN